MTTALHGRLPDRVVAKSFGCFALPWAVRLGIPGTWLTPVTTHDAVAGALTRTTDAHDAVGGAADPLWQPQRLAGSGARLQTVAGADHALEVAGDWRRSQRLQSDVLELVDQRLRALVAVR